MKVKKIDLFYNKSGYSDIYLLDAIEVNSKYRITEDIMLGKDCRFKKIYDLCYSFHDPDRALIRLVEAYGVKEVLIYVDTKLTKGYTLKDYKNFLKEQKQKALNAVTKIKKNK